MLKGPLLLAITPNYSQTWAGDNRTEWSLVDTTTESVALTGAGKRGLAGALVGGTGTILALSVGTGTATAANDDVDFETETTSEFAFGITTDQEDVGGVDESTATVRSVFRFHEFGDSLSEIGAVTDRRLLVARATMTLSSTADTDVPTSNRLFHSRHRLDAHHRVSLSWLRRFSCERVNEPTLAKPAHLTKH